MHVKRVTIIIDRNRDGYKVEHGITTDLPERVFHVGSYHGLSWLEALEVVDGAASSYHPGQEIWGDLSCQLSLLD